MPHRYKCFLEIMATNKYKFYIYTKNMYFAGNVTVF